MTGGELLGKFIILSFRDDEEALFSKAISAFASVADLSTVAASADAPLLFGSLQIDPQRRLVREAGQTVDLTPMEFDILLLLAAGQGRCSPPARSTRLLPRTPMTQVGRESPAWSTSSAVSWAPVSSKRCGATATASHQNNRTAPSRLYRGGAALS